MNSSSVLPATCSMTMTSTPSLVSTSWIVMMFGWQETVTPLGVGQFIAAENLERDCAVEPCIARPIDLAHPTRSEKIFDAVRTDLG